MGNPQLWFRVAIWLKYNVPSACCPTPQPLLKPGHVSIISSILCMPNVLLFTGMLEKVWKRVNFLKPVKIWLLSKRIMKKLELIQLMLKVAMRAKNTEEKLLHKISKRQKTFFYQLTKKL